MGLEKGTVKIKGTDYKLVVKRVDEFRLKFKGYGIDTKVIDLGFESGFVVVEAKIKDPQNQVVGSGLAEEKRNSSLINKTACLMNCETSAIGRALASMGLGGQVYASADELVNSLTEQNIEASLIPEPKKRPEKEKTLVEKAKNLFTPKSMPDEKAKNIFKPKSVSDDEVKKTFSALIKAYGFKLENEGCSAIEGILKICSIQASADRGGRDELLTLHVDRQKALIPVLKKAV